MPTFKQLEALCAIAKLGSFEAAASELHTTQSAISKRIKELEEAFGLALFDRRGRAARLTAKGAEMMEVAVNLLDQREDLVLRMSDPAALSRRIRVGVTEMTAMTWLARWVQSIQPEFPRLILEPEVLPSDELRHRLASGRLDLIVVPDAFGDARLTSVTVGELRYGWFCKPGLVAKDSPISRAELCKHTMVTQAHPASGSMPLTDLLRRNGVVMAHALTANNVLSIIALTLAGFGVSYLPDGFVSPLVDQGRLHRFRTDIDLPPIAYVALYRDPISPTFHRLADLARTCCDFSTMFQLGAEKVGSEKAAG